MSQVILEIPKRTYRDIWKHLLPRKMRFEEAAFGFVQATDESPDLAFHLTDWFPVEPDEFVHRSAHYLELTDEMRARVIKQAHDRGASIAEFHSHLSSAQAQFSASDGAGFEEVVPHIWWRLKGKPYFAVVVSRSNFDTLAWLSDPKTPQALMMIRVGKQLRQPTGRTLQRWRQPHE